MRTNKSKIAFFCLLAGLILYPFGLYLSKVAGHDDTYPNSNPWELDLFHDVVVPLPVIIPSLLIIAGCLFSVQVIVVIARDEGIAGLLRMKTLHLWCGAALFIYIILAFM